ncbi:hypothetical protein [Yersinia phage fEV-1]|jgi:hypothetical protein|nr:hypothetical protein [Yersinia phage fEV-1]
MYCITNVGSNAENALHSGMAALNLNNDSVNRNRNHGTR